MIINNKKLNKLTIIQKKKLIYQKINFLLNSIKKELKVFSFFELPQHEIIFFFKKKMLQSFSFSKNNFDKKINFYSVPRYFFYYIFFLIKLVIYNKKKVTKKSFFLLVDNIETIYEANLYDTFYKFINKNKICYRILNPKVKKNNSYYFSRYKFYNLNYLDFKFLIKFLFIGLIISIKYRFNFLYISLKLIDEYFYFRNFFTFINAKFIIMHQYYYSSNIKNFLFKKNKGLQTCLIQKNINSQNENGLLHSADIFFTLGKNTYIDNKNTYSNIKKNLPIGSLLMKNNRKTFLNKKNDIDILYLGGNGLLRDSYYNSYPQYLDNYKEILGWLSKISLEFPNLKVCYKDHKNNYDFGEKKIIGRSNVIFLDKDLDSYHLSDNSKFICSWASTMILECRSRNFYSFFLDPDNRNDQFLYGIKHRKELSITNYQKFKNLILKSQKKKFFKKNDIKFCDHKKNPSKIICQYLLNQH